MAEQVFATVRRVDLEPKEDVIDAHVFLQPRESREIDLYTRDPLLQTAFLLAWRPPPTPGHEVFPPLIEVHYELIDQVKRATRVAFDYEVGP